MKRLIFPIIMLLAAMTLTAQNPKREFRGAWMHTIGQSQYKRQSSEQNQQYLCDQLDRLQATGVNAVIWQIRPAADALYDSRYELWSKFLTDGAKAPSPYWDPLQFMIEECHKRGMELHAWLNPYRVTTGPKETLPAAHLYHKEPWRFVIYDGDGKIYFDPGIPENREYIRDIVVDIIDRYDVDAIHFDDYFYPYPANGKDFPDEESYAKYGQDMDRGDWRRQNVDQLIEMLHTAIRDKSPWVRFGVSPFGIWRNKSTDPRGSETRGMQCYDALYADALLWAEKGWIDYLVPQLYWSLQHNAASYIELVGWWADAVDTKCQLYIGQDVKRSMDEVPVDTSYTDNQLAHKIDLMRQEENIQGNCWWPGYKLTENYLGAADSLINNYQSTIALVPAYTGICTDRPLPPSKLKVHGAKLSWSVKEAEGLTTDPCKYVVYCFDSESMRDYDDPANIVAVTSATSFEASQPGIYAVTVLDRVNNESDPSIEVKVKMPR